MEAIVALGKAISDPVRVRILALLLRSEACVCELVDALELGQSSVSSHLQTLRVAGLVKTDRRRNWVIYSLTEFGLNRIAPLLEGTRNEAMKADLERFEKRLGIRVDGCCVVGFVTTQKEA